MRRTNLTNLIKYRKLNTQRLDIMYRLQPIQYRRSIFKCRLHAEKEFPQFHWIDAQQSPPNHIAVVN